LVRASLAVGTGCLLAIAVHRLPAQQAGRDSSARDTTAADSVVRSRLPLLPPQASPLTVDLRTRVEAKGERVRDERCVAGQFGASFRCAGSFQPTFDFEFNLRSMGTVGERIFVDVDYDTQREFDASNRISLAYRGTPHHLIESLEVGNVSFAPPVSRFLTSGIPSNNYGVLTSGSIGPVRFSAIAAQQKGNVVTDQVFTVGDRTRSTEERAIEDYQIEPRRFFFTVDPTLFGSAYPNIDILDGARMQALAASLPDTVRPSRVFVYRLLLGGQPRNPNGPQFRILGDPTSQRGQVYELLREQVDYYMDPSQLWLALVTPLNQNTERLVVAYTVKVGGRDTVIASVGGTPDLEFVAERDQFAQLVWDPRLTPDDPAFRREIRSVYRIGGSDVVRESVKIRIVTGQGIDQEKPPGGVAETWLKLFGLAERSNGAAFDIANRLWPRPTDPVVSIGPDGNVSRLLRDQFLVFPSAEPFSRRGLASSPLVPANDSIYLVPSEYLYSLQHPQSFYRISARYEAEGDGARGEIALNAVQLRPNSEQVVVDGEILRRGVDYEMDYELGRIVFRNPEVLFPVPRRVRVRYEENPLFTTIPTTIFGLTTLFPADNGEVAITAIQQTQRTTFTRPPLGFEPASSLVAGVRGMFTFDAAPLGRAIERVLPWGGPIGKTTVEVNGEFAVSRPQSNSRGQAYVESFEGEGGLRVRVDESRWYYGSQPAIGDALPGVLAPSVLDLSRASTMAWQNNGVDRDGDAISFTLQQIDPQAALVGAGVAPPEPTLWLSLYPLSRGGLRDPASGQFKWQIDGAPSGRRWRSLRTAFDGAGADLSRVETVEFWTLVDTAAARRNTNPVLVLDFGDVSENSVAFAPETLSVAASATGIDSTYGGRQLQGFDVLDTERDAFSRAFNVDVNDTGLPGDVVDEITVRNATAIFTRNDIRICQRRFGALPALGDAGANCSVRNNRLDEEDLDDDQVLNFSSARREEETIRRYVVDLADPASINRVGTCGVEIDDVNRARPLPNSLCWVNVRLPFNEPTEELNGGPQLRRVRALRLTVVSGAGATDDAFTLLPLTGIRLLGAPWLKRSDRVLRGIAGNTEGSGTVIATVIGTADRDTVRGIFYEPPPGVVDAPDNQQTSFNPLLTQVNERSIRLIATGMQPYDRAEAYFRFPEGERSFMSYREMRLWARGRGNGWGLEGELSFYVKIGRDNDNFYLYRTEVRSGNLRSAWEPEIRVRFERFQALRARLQNAFLRGTADSLACTGIDSVLIAHAGVPPGRSLSRYAACADGYMVYSVDPGVTPPNLAAVQELAVGIIRLEPSGLGSTPLLPGDTAEVWVDDIRLSDVVNETGFAGQFGVSVRAGDLLSLRMNVARRDPNFRQLGEAPTFLTSDDLDIGATLRLEKLIPGLDGFAMPMTISHVRTAADPLFLAGSDIEGAAVEDLRTPQSGTTSISLGFRRTTPLTGSWYAPILNHLAVTGNIVADGNRSAYQDAHGRDATLSFDFLVNSPVASGGDVRPGSLSRLAGSVGLLAPLQAVGADALRFQPTRFRLTSAMVRNTDRRVSFLKPAAALDDSATVVRNLDQVWRTGLDFEFRPLSPVRLNWGIVSLRDLRDYGDSTRLGRVIDRQSNQLAGLDLGLERERRMETSVTFTPDIASWIRPRAEFASTFSSFSNTQATTLVLRPGADSAALPRRIANSQRFTTGAVLDLRALGGLVIDSSSWFGRILAVVDPVDVSFNRDVLSAYDGAAASPGLGYQLGLGPARSFRSIDGELAAASGLADQFSLTQTLTLPFNLSVAHRLQHAVTHNWTRRGENALMPIDGRSETYPDLAVRWGTRGAALDGLVENASLNARMLVTRALISLPSELQGRPDERRATRVESYPLTAQATLGPAAGALQATAGYTWSERVDSLPGSVTTGTSRDISADLGRSFTLPEDWDVQSPVRARISFQRTDTRSFVANRQAEGSRSRLTDNGRQSLSLNADTDLSESLTLSLQGARVVNFDRNFNRRITQTLLSAVLQFQFFGGALR
jgi:cell surface protein SprA